MKRRILTLFLAALTVGLLGSCKKINERIDGLDRRVDNIELEKIASIQNQIAAINASIADLGTIRKDIADLQAAVEAKGEDISELQAADKSIIQRLGELQAADAAIEKRLGELKTVVGDLSRYAEKDWATATFATLEQLNATNDELSALKEIVDGLGGIIDEKIAKVKSSLSASISSAIRGVNASISELEARVIALEKRIQSVTIIPAYSDGSVEEKGGILRLDIIVEPAGAIASLTKDNLKVLVNEVKTKAVDVDEVPVADINPDAATGIVKVRANILSKLPAAGSQKALTVAIKINNVNSDYITEFYPIFSSTSNVTVTPPTTSSDTTKVNIQADEDFPESVMGNIEVQQLETQKPASFTMGGIGTVIFDKTATEKIKSNAAGAKSVSFKVEDVTTTKPVPNADVVLEVTMKTVDENGKEVFNEENADGVVTIQIPTDPDIAYVNNVTLVNDAGDPIEGGVIPGTEEVENGILTFKVNHFSKYAIDYVTTNEVKSVDSVILDPVSTTLDVGDTLRLSATIAPADATNPKVTWVSSDTTKVKVDNTGKVTAIAGGTATITVTTKDGGKTATCEVTVTVEASTGYTVTFDPNIFFVTAPTSQTVDENGKVIKPEDPTAPNGSIVTFDGWYKTKDETTGVLSDEWNFETDEVTADITLYAQWKTTISQIVGTNNDVPKSENFDWKSPGNAEIPKDAWVDATSGNKAFWVPGEDGGFAMLYKEETEDGIVYYAFGPDDTDTFYMVDYNKYVCTNDFGTFTCTMTSDFYDRYFDYVFYNIFPPGVFTSLTFVGNDLSGDGMLDFRNFNGIYAVDSASETEQYNNNNNPGWSFN